MPAVLDRVPTLDVIANGVRLPNITRVHIDRGLDQTYAKAQISIPWPAPIEVKKGSNIVVRTGVTNIIERFVGYVKNISTELWSPRITLDCVDVMGYLETRFPDQEYNLDGMTDTAIILFVLDKAGIPPSMIGLITGNDEIISDFAGAGEDVPPALIWDPLVSAADMIKQIDDVSLGRRTYALTSGQITRRYISQIPFFTPAYTFTEGVNVMSGSMTMTEEEPTTQVQIYGAEGSSVVSSSSNPYAWYDQPYLAVHAMLQKTTPEAGFISTEDVANHVLSLKSRNLLRLNFATQDDVLIEVPSTIRYDSVHMYVLQNLICNSLSFDTDSSGKWRQSLGCVSELMDNENAIPVVVAFGPLAGMPLTPVLSTLPVPSNADIICQFTILGIDKETLADNSTVYVVSCSDLSTSMQGTIVSRSWAATGTGVTVAAGTENTFTTSFTDLTDAVITLSVTDSNGSTGNSSQNPLNSGVPIRIRKLYVMKNNQFGAFDGNVWRYHTPSGGRDMTCIGHGPIAAAEDMFLYTTDDLLTPANEVIIRAGINITAVWVEPDVSANNIIAGFADGVVATSSDGGATWTVRTAPSGAQINRIILSRFNVGEVHAVNANGYYVSHNYGDGWVLIRAGNFVDLQLSHAGRNVVVTNAGALEEAVSGTAFTFPSVSPPVVILNVTEHIRQNKVYAQDDQGRTWQQFGEASGSYAMLQGVDIPEGAVQVRGAYRDGLVVDMVYFAAGAGGLWKSLDGYRSSQGYLKLLAA